MVPSMKFKINEITDRSGDHLGIKDESRGTSLVGSDDDRDISGERGDNTCKGYEDCSELHI
jgi:hypothetical protein